MTNEIARREPDHLENALAIRDEHTDGWIAVVQPIAELAAQVASTDFVPKGLRDKPAAITAAILFGRELAMPPMHALSNIHMVEGKPTLAAETMRAMVLAAGHELGYGEVSGSVCEVKGRRSGASEWTIVRWTIADAQRAGVANKGVWKSYPRQMLTARATAELCRMIFPDVTHNIRATEELEDGGDEMLGGGGPSAPPADTTRVSRAKAGTTKTRATSPAPAVASGPLHGDPIAPPAPVGSGQAVRSSTDAPGSAPGEVVPGAAAELPPTTTRPAWSEGDFLAQCPHISNGVRCAYRVHEGLHSYEVDPPAGGTAGDGSPDDVAATGTDEEYQRMLDEQAAEPAHREDSPTPTGPVPDAPKPMIAAQTKALQSRFRGLGWTDEPDDKESRLRVVSTILGRAENNQVETFRSGMVNEGGMSYDEAQTVLTRLAPCRSRDDVLELMVSITKALTDEEQAP